MITYLGNRHEVCFFALDGEINASSVKYPSIMKYIGEAIDLSGFDLYVPCLGLGNVCQLAFDAVLSTLYSHEDVHYAGYLQSDLVQPVFGAKLPSLLGGSNARNLELHVSKSRKSIFLIQRAPALDAFQEFFVRDLISWAEAVAVKNIFLIGGMNASMLNDPTSVDIRNRIISFSAPSAVPRDTASLDSSDSTGRLCNLEIFDNSKSIMPISTEKTAVNSGASLGNSAISLESMKQTELAFSSIWNSGYAPVYYRQFLDRFLKASSALDNSGEERVRINPYFILIYIAEGDNRFEAMTLANALLYLLGVHDSPVDRLSPEEKKLSELVLPPYWDTMFGANEYDPFLYG